MRIAAALLCSFGCAAFAVETTEWPPRDEVAARMRELQAVISAGDSSLAQRDAAREELVKLLKSPNAVGRAADEKPARMAPRAAVEPIGSMVRPVPNPVASVPGVAKVEIVEPSKIPIVPQSGAPTIPAARAAVDPRTGHVLHETPNGYIDPRTGAFTPR
jgi:hypothetical protein